MKKIGILGAGKSGIAAANLAVKLGYEVFISDSEKKRFVKNLNAKVVKEFGGHSDEILNSDIIIKSPGICGDIDILKKAKKKKIKILSDLEFSLNNSKYKKIIAITGTNGKTTTTDLTAKIIKSAYKDSIVTGNIGFPLSDKALKTTKNTIITMELSSYQLEDTPEFRPDISVLLNVTPDHLEHHKTMANYIKAKENVFVNQKQKDFAIINYDDKICRKLADKTKAKVIFFSRGFLKKGVFYDNGNVIIKIDKEVKIKPKINIVGMHNVENILAAAAAAYCAGVAPAIIEKVISSYKGVEHRIEYVRSVGGVAYYNDSKSTNVDSARVALESFDKNILLIMGGRDKGAPYTPLKKLIKDRVKTIYLVGESAGKIRKDLPLSCCENCGDIQTAVKKISAAAKSGDVVLFSPACASFDQFNNFEERGQKFKKLVKAL
ncbi:UDP-N-acetylmuramoyl-L-alanine--D-glutamate ligase [Endomicrobium proavitum]|uniref:UDP-N-acetylmuramoyl-L-alanine--D-glutamate ligase n=1 Tax=Endomicrobium proavitum TaxID=1408281 RepID=UPI000698F62F|nr:UDP-N-acetylmuramoyl-L-alanine--D-glutamate ligase [Endomicrobium proavitum]